MTTLYLDRDHVDISARTGHLRLRTGSGRSTTVPLSQLERLVVRGRVALDSNVIGSLADKGIAVTFLGGRSHRRLAMLLGRGGQDSQRRLLQYGASSNENWCCQASRRLLVAKLAATCHELDAILQQRPDRRRVLVQARRSISRRIDTLEVGAGNRDTMLGLEGGAARVWFQALAEVLPSELGFAGRNRRPPRDPFNSCLSLGYTLIHADACAAVWALGLDPMLGFLHQPLHGRESLACDLIEPLRPRIDRAMHEAFANRRLRADHFSNTAQGCYLTKTGRGHFYPLWESLAGPWRRYLRRSALAVVRELEQSAATR